MIPEVYLILIKDGRILLSRRFQTGYEDGKYSLVAGHVEGRETMREAMAREAREEASITIDPLSLKHLLTLHRWCGDHERLGCYFTIDEWGGEIANAEPDRCGDLSWFPLDVMPENVVPYVRAAIDCSLKGEKYHEFGWDGCHRGDCIATDGNGNPRP